MIIEVIDLGFNRITNASADVLKRGMEVVSSSRIEKKVCDLHVNMAGNQCDTYVYVNIDYGNVGICGNMWE